MDLFPDEAHVRLRNRGHETYLHADEDGAGISLRPHGRVPSRSAVWRVHRVPLRGTTYLLFESTAYGSYLAVSPDLAPPGYGGRRAVQRNYDADTNQLEPAEEDVAWRAVRADDEDDDAYVSLRNFDRTLRANGKHRIWHTGVTVASNSDANSSTMMHWTVEVVPLPSPSSRLANNRFSYLPAGNDNICKLEIQWAPLEKDSLSSPTKLSGQECVYDDSVLVGPDVRTIACSVSDITFPRLDTCLGCSKKCTNCLCQKCTRKMKTALLKAKEASLGTGSFSFCLKCSVLAQGDHFGGAHDSDCIPLQTFDGSQVAWVTKKERWCAIFSGIQSDRHWNRFLGRPFLLHKPQGHRCEVCGDHLTDDKLYGTLIKFCTIECWANKAKEAAEFDWLGALMKVDFDRLEEQYCFCIVCRCLFVGCEDDPKHMHDQDFKALRVITEFMGGTTATKIEVPTNHYMAAYWKCIKDLDDGDMIESNIMLQDLDGGETLSSPNHIFRLRDESAQRCKGCKLRLEDGGGQMCSLECRLHNPMMPRQVQIHYKLSKSPGDQEPEI